MGGSQHLFPHQLELAQNLVVRPPLEKDDDEFARLLSTLMAAGLDAEMLRDRRKRWSQKYWFDRVAELDGKVVGIVEMIQSGSPTAATVRIVVAPEHRRRGIGTALLGELKANPEFQSRKIFADVRDDDPNSFAFAESIGLRKRWHMFESCIDPQSFDIAPFRPYIEQVRASGLRIAAVEELGDTEENRFKLWEIENITDGDIAGFDPDELTSWEDAKKSWYTASWYNPAGEFVALDGDKWVGLSGIAELSPGTFYVQHTCTLREYRGRGIAMALKALATENARQRGGRQLRTNNHDGNEAMLAINAKFGFKPEPGWLQMVREPLRTEEK